VLKVNEIFCSIQGESTHAGRPCTFIRLAGCNLRCMYCDTRYAYEKGRSMSVAQALDEVRDFGMKLVAVTGGEPLVQESTPGLVGRLLDQAYEVLVETNGSLPIDSLPAGAVRIMDIKCPDSGCSHMNRWENIELLGPNDEVKFVMSSVRDYEWAREVIARYDLASRANVLASVVHGVLAPDVIADRILADRLPVRLQLQLHKYIWPGGERPSRASGRAESSTDAQRRPSAPGAARKGRPK